MKKNKKVEEEKLEIDESLLSEEEKKEMGFHFPLWPLILIGVIVLLMIVCIIFIVNLS